MSVPSGGGGDEPGVMVEINTTPLIDVMLVLLVMLIITIPIQMHATKLDMPQNQNNPPPPKVDPVVIDLYVDFDGTITWNGTVVRIGQLDRYFRIEANRPVQPELHLRTVSRSTTPCSRCSQPRSARAW
jgi:biopolymer transport protein ExbD